MRSRFLLISLALAASGCPRGSEPSVAARPPAVVASAGEPAGSDVTAGRLLFSRVLAGDRVDVKGVALAPSGEIVVAGRDYATTDAGRPSSNALVVGLDAAGNERFRHRVGGPGASYATGVAVGPRGLIAVIGRASGQTDLAPAELDSALFLELLDASGKRLWARAWPGVDRKGHVAFTRSGQIVVAVELEHDLDLGGGVLALGDHKFDSAIAELDASGRHLWSRLAGGASLDAVATGPSGEVVVSGGFTDSIVLDGQQLVSAGHWDGLVAKLDANGRRVWAVRFGGDTYDRAQAVAVDGHGRVAVGGACASHIDFAGTPSDSKSSQDPCVAVLGPSGRLEVLHRYAQDRGSGIVHALAWVGDRVAVSGRFSGIVDFGGAEPLAAYHYDVFVAELDAKSARFASRFYTTHETTFERQAVAADSRRVIVAGPFTESVDFGAGEEAPPPGGGVYVLALAP